MRLYKNKQEESNPEHFPIAADSSHSISQIIQQVEGDKILLKVFISFQFGTIGVYLISFLIDFFISGQLNLLLLRFGVILAACVLIGLISYLYMKDHIKSEIWAWFSVFLIMSFLLMTLNDRFPNLLGIEIENEHLGICGLIILIVASMHILSQHTWIFAISASVLVFAHMIKQIVCGYQANQILIEVSTTTLATIYLICFFYYQRKCQYEVVPDYLAKDSTVQPESQQFTIKTNAEKIYLYLKPIKRFIKNCMPREQSLTYLNYIKKTLEIVQSGELYNSNINELMDKLSPDERKIVDQILGTKMRSSEIQSSYQSLPDKNMTFSDQIIVTESLQGQMFPILNQIGQVWSLDTFQLGELSYGKPLQQAANFLMQKLKFYNLLQIQESISQNFYKKLESQYKSNPYHNSTHATDVTCSGLFLSMNSDLIQHQNQFEEFCFMLACFSHDVGHPGLTNRYLINSKDQLAIRYNDKSILEMMHCSIVFQLLTNSDTGLMQNIDNQEYVSYRELIIDLVLATDMSHHNEILAKFKAKYSYQELDYTCQEQRIELMKVLIKCADIGHTAKKTALHEKWSRLVIEEFNNQAKLEEEQNLPITMPTLKTSSELGKSQSGFIRAVAFPLYEACQIVLCSESIEKCCIQQLKANAEFWDNFAGQRVQRRFTRVIEDENKFLRRKIHGHRLTYTEVNRREVE